MAKRGQVWAQDAIFAVVIMIASVTLFIFGYSNIIENNDGFNEVYHENRVISEYLMLEGTPLNWNVSNVIRIGIMNRDYTLNETKLEYLYNMSLDDYDDSRNYLGTRFDYMIFFTQNDGTLLNLTKDYFIGKENINSTNILDEDTQVITKTERYLIQRTYNGTEEYRKIIKMIVYSWK